MLPAPDPDVMGRIHTLQDQELLAPQKLWELYYERLVRLALQHLRSRHRPGAWEDGEDVALSAFHSFCRSASEGRYPRLEDGHALWSILIVITRRKAAALVKREGRRKRGGGWRRHDAVFDELRGMEPGPDDAALAADLYRTLFARIDDERVRAAVQLHMEGWTSSEVAESLGCSVPTVDRWLRRVRQLALRLWGPFDDEVGRAVVEL